MRLNVLSLDVRAERGTGQDTQIGIMAKVVPAGPDKIRLGASHVFAEHNFKSAFERIDAQLWIRAEASRPATAKALLPESMQKDEDPAGYAKAVIPKGDNEPAILSFVVFTDETRLAQILKLVDGVGAGSITIDVFIDGLKFVLPDEEKWVPHDPDHASQYLPIRHFVIQVSKLRTTRRAIREASETNGNKELADSDDPETRKLAMTWVKDASRDAAERSPNPSLAILRHCRALLAFLLICAATAIIQRL